jgi:archaemetzincin
LKKLQPTTGKGQQTSLFNILPMGDIPEILTKTVAAHIQAYLNLETDILPPSPIPVYAFDQKRIQYNAAPIIQDIEHRAEKEKTKILGIVDIDLFIPVFTHVLGEARQGGKAALISCYRILEHRDRPPAPSSLSLERAAKIALHETSHLFDLAHCMDDQCLMHFSGSLEDLDRLSFTFCRYCSSYLLDAMGRSRLKSRSFHPENVF